MANCSESLNITMFLRLQLYCNSQAISACDNHCEVMKKLVHTKLIVFSIKKVHIMKHINFANVTCNINN